MWSVEFDPNSQLLTVRMIHQVSGPQMRALARAHIQAVGASGGGAFKILADMRGLTPLDIEAAGLLSEIWRTGRTAPGYRARVVLTDSPTVALQQRRAVIEEGGDPKKELVTMDEAEARNFLSRA